MSNILTSINNSFDKLNNSKLFAGIIMILLNLGSKYIVMELSETHEEFLNNVIIRRIIVFTVAFTATRDIITSIILTGAFIIMVSGLFNENSKYCILPIKNKKKYDKNEIMNAHKILEWAKKNNLPN
jgi:biotin synthase-like enzyme